MDHLLTHVLIHSMKPKLAEIEAFNFLYHHFIFSFTEEWKVEENGTFSMMTLEHSLDRFTYYPEILAVDYNFCQI